MTVLTLMYRQSKAPLSALFRDFALFWCVSASRYPICVGQLLSITSSPEFPEPDIVGFSDDPFNAAAYRVLVLNVVAFTAVTFTALQVSQFLHLNNLRETSRIILVFETWRLSAKMPHFNCNENNTKFRLIINTIRLKEWKVENAIQFFLFLSKLFVLSFWGNGY